LTSSVKDVVIATPFFIVSFMSDLVVKDNALMNASYNLNLVEQRLILLAILEARRTNKGINANDPLTIRASDYIEQFDVHRVTAYQALKDACNVLFSRYFSYQELSKGKTKNVKSRWVSRIAYVDDLAQVELIFAPDVVPLITELESRFSQYAIEQVSNLSSAYAVRLYELLITWRKSCTVPEIELNDFRRRLGVTDSEYTRTESFKRRVLDLAITQINEHTDIFVSYEQHNKGRVITGFSFSFKFKKAPKAEKQKALASPKAQDLDAEKREAYAQFIGYQQRAKLLNEPIENLLTKKELAQFRKFEFMK
jgi:plasmid replication initiation protein